MRFAAVSLLALAVLAACAEPASEPDQAAPDEEVATTAPVATDVPAAANEIPEAVRGEWGINLADCDVSTGAAKGNLKIDAESLKFYESVAKLDRINSLSKVGIGAEFRFSGEGEEWTRTMQLSVSPDSKTLTREEIGPDAMDEPLTYQRCPE